jgi:hypothetical protein
LTEWLRRKDCPALYYQALDKPVELELEAFADAVAWRARKQFRPEDVNELDELAQHVPGAEPTTVRVGVSRTGFAAGLDLDVALTPDDLLDAWR